MIVIITDLLTERNKFFTMSQLNNSVSPQKDQIVSKHFS